MIPQNHCNTVHTIALVFVLTYSFPINAIIAFYWVDSSAIFSRHSHPAACNFTMLRRASSQIFRQGISLFPILFYLYKTFKTFSLLGFVRSLFRTSTLATEAATTPRLIDTTDELHSKTSNEDMCGNAVVVAPPEFRFIYPEFLPDPAMERRNKLREKLERMDMLQRRSALEIPEFYTGTVFLTTVNFLTF